MTNHSIVGDWMDNAYLAGRGRLHITIEPDGAMHVTYEAQETVFLRQFGNDCPVITNGIWTFAPDNREIDRLAKLGVAPKQMIDRDPG